MLKISNLEAWYGKLHIIKNISLDIQKGSFVSIIWPNWSWKSTLLKSIVWLTTISKWKISFLRKDITNLKTYKYIKYWISYVKQTENIFPKLTVKENLEIAWATLDPEIYKKNLSEVFQLFPTLLKECDKIAWLLSWWQRQILAIGMAYLHKPKLLLLDEPTAWLSPKSINAVFNVINKIHTDGVTIVIVEHNVKKILEYCTDIIILKDGKIAISAPREELDDEKIKDIYFN